MSLLQNIKDAQFDARKDRETVKVGKLATIIGDIMAIAKNDGDREVVDKDVIKTLTKFIAGQTTMIEAATKINDQARIDEAKAEIVLFQSFLPAAKPQLEQDKLRLIIESLIKGRLTSEPNQKPKMGIILADLKVLHEGEYEPKLAAELTKNELAEYTNVLTPPAPPKKA